MRLPTRKTFVFIAAAAAVLLSVSPASAASHSTRTAAVPGLVAAAAASSHLMGPAAAKPDTDYVYYSGNTGGGARHASSIYAYMTADAASASDSQVVCVQEHVYPNWPSTTGSFFDQYKCGTGSVGVSLNGENVDQAYCWVDGSTVSIACGESY
jgi:hypothetical protein